MARTLRRILQGIKIMNLPDKGSEKWFEKNEPPFCTGSPWKQNENVIWLGSTLTLRRNLEKYHFPGKLSIDKRKQIISLVVKDLLASGQLKEPKLLQAEEISSVEKEFFVEHFLSSQSFHQAGDGEAFVVDKSGEFLALLNIGDHITLQWIDAKEALEETWDRLVQIEQSLIRSINFAFSPKFGFLTADPNLSGTGLVATIFLHLPALLHTGGLAEAVKKNKGDGIEQTGFQGNPNEYIGDIVAFHNSYTLGVTEENILSSLHALATKLVVEENGVRRLLKQGIEGDVAECKDKVSRAYAILLHSYQIEASEALEALSMIKMGLDFGWLTGVTQSSINELLFTSRFAHLLYQYNQKIPHEELPHKRAEFIHRALSTLHLEF